MTHSNGEMTYRVLTSDREYAEVYERLQSGDLLWAIWPEIEREAWSANFFAAYLGRDDIYVLEGYVDGHPAGLMTLLPFGLATLTAEIGVTAYRGWFDRAPRLCMGALLKGCEDLGMASIIGRVAAPNRHILRMLDSMGFSEIGRVPGMMWHARKQKFVDGVLVMATPATIRQRSIAMGFGGGYSAPDPAPAPEPAPEKQPTKSVSAGAQAAQQAQREKQKKNRGLAASIMTNRGGLASSTSGNETLG